MKLTIRNKLACFILVISLSVAFFPDKAYADQSIHTDRPVTISVSAMYSGQPLENVEYELYKVADFDEAGEYTVTEKFSRYPVSLNGKNHDADNALTMAVYASKDNLIPEENERTGKNGRVTFPASGKEMYPGMYLLLAQPMSENGYTYEIAPVLIDLPNYDETEGAFKYDVAVETKSFRIEEKEETVECSVYKVWEGDSRDSRPKQITVQLLRNGKKYDTVVLSDDNSWFYLWKKLPMLSADGTVNQWSIYEETVPGYNVKIYSDGTYFKITNSAIKTTGQYFSDTTKKLPQTGLLWWPIPILALVGTAFLLLGSMERDRKSKK